MAPVPSDVLPVIKLNRDAHIIVCWHGGLGSFGRKLSIKPRKIIKGSNDEYWISDDIYGLVKRNNRWSFDVFTPTGPASYISWNLDFDGEALWVASGALTGNMNNQYQTKGVYKYENNSWSSFNGGAYDSLFDITLNNIIINEWCKRIHQKNSQHYSFGICRINASNDDC